MLATVTSAEAQMETSFAAVMASRFWLRRSAVHVLLLHLLAEKRRT
jgi:hypothetical protein